MIFRSILIVIVLFTINLFSSPSNFYSVEQQNDNSLVIQFNFPDVEIEKNENGSGYALISIQGLRSNFEDGKPLLPVFDSPVVVPPGKVTYSILSQEVKTYPGVIPALYYGDTVSTRNFDLKIKSGQNTIQPPAVYPEKIMNLEESGIFRDYRVMGLRLYPVQSTPDGIRFYKSVKIRIKFPVNSMQATAPVLSNDKKVISDFAINSEQIGRIAPSVPQNQNPPNTMLGQTSPENQAKIYVDKKGIYRVYGSDLVDGRVDITAINPQTLRLTNKGEEVPILIHGDQDMVFDSDDYIEFWGEKNEKTFFDKYPDVYEDPFSDLNVYWLSWGGAPGVRIVEESGAIVQTNPTKYNPAYFYSHTVHFEQDNFFERLGYGNTHNYSHTRDLWFFDSGIQAVGKKTYNVDLIYPDSSSFNPVRVKVVMSGKSQSTHNAMVWLNQQLVGQSGGNWYWQNVYTVDNENNSSIRSADLRHGTNQLEIQMPVPPPSDQSDIVMLNWANITYDRQYRAYHDYLEFTRPSPSVVYYPDITLYQFEIENFTRPDIEIYKKGISKIVNYNLSAQGIGSQRRYKIIFQDEILSDDVEYIALTPDQKLKPVRIEQDQPYDAHNPYLSLRSPANSADYLIITHDKFYFRAADFVNYRKQQGLNVVIVKVQDIYDEFNYGIKSPIAIQDFLKYAFYNWDRNHRLKYVLLLGTAHYDHKTQNQIFEDFVPTFYFQSDRFGAVATDLPYALVSGDDYLPDLFVGRVPVMTTGDVSIFTQKIMEYEQNQLTGSWRNQTLFISGNDKSTMELPDDNRVPHKPAFRTQNQRLIDLLLPRNFSAFKLNTIKDTTLQYDPNFGGTTDLIEYFDNGINFATFLGHGGGAIWADVNLLNLNDVSRLNNKNMYPFIASMTCFTGAFDNPGKRGLAQELLLANEKGAIGLVASSGLGWVNNDYAILWNLMQELFTPGRSVGEAVTFGKIDYFLGGQYVVGDTLISSGWGHPSLRYDMIHQYNLIGDPYTALKHPQEDIELQLDKRLPQPGDTISVQINAPFTSAEGYLELTDGKNSVKYREPLFYSGSQAFYQIPVAEDFPTGPGFVRAYLASDTRDAVGVQTIGVNYSVFDSVQTIPASPNAEDSVAIQFVVKFPEPAPNATMKINDSGFLAQRLANLTNVRVNAFIPFSTSSRDTIQWNLMTEMIAPNTYRTTSKIPPTYAIRTVYYYIYATDSSGTHTSRMNYNYRVQENRPDPFIYTKSIRLVGDSKARLGISIGNSGEVPATNVELKVYQGKDNYLNDQPFASQLVSLDERDSLTKKIEYPFPLNQPAGEIYAVLDRQHNSPDFNRFNNIDSSGININIYNLTPELGSTYDNIHNDTIDVAGIHKFRVAPGGISQPSAVLLRIDNFDQEHSQTGLTPVPLAEGSSLRYFEIALFNKFAKFSAPFQLDLKYNKIAVDTAHISYDDLKFYRWDEQMQSWVQEDAVLDTASGYFSAQVDKPGLFAPFISSDKKPPRIELTVDGRHVRTKTLVSPSPVLNVVLEDESGLNFVNNEITILMDNLPVPKEQVFIPDSVKQSKIIGLTVYPELSVGQHFFSVDVKDVNGNISSREYTLRVDDEFDLHVFGNYPNPFSDETIFSYYINSTEIIDEFEIRIFTLSGRLIKRIKNDVNTVNPENDPRRTGYNELIWDGTDDAGNDVANGVYFAVIRAEFQGEQKQEILKVAKLK